MVRKIITDERVSSGISGLDKIIEGGYEKNSAVLITGGGGSGKTIVGVQFLVEGIANHDETGIYVSFEESKEKFYKHMIQFGWDLEEWEKKGRFVFVSFSPQEMIKIIQTRGTSLESVIKEVKAKRITIDSLSAFSALFERESDQREMLVALFKMISKWDCTTVVIAEEDQDIVKPRSTVMGLMADAIIRLFMILKPDYTMGRAMQVFKMRGTKHSFKVFPINITTKGIEAYPDAKIECT
ncbi:hypothetical protein FJZ53_00460 [Candidatus Woesearchaeota archaeon]|nr:hypothetical protein [Candidatus Woesearchaeota archaeon]